MMCENCGNCYYFVDNLEKYGCQHPEYEEHKKYWGELVFEGEVDCIFWTARE